MRCDGSLLVTCCLVPRITGRVVICTGRTPLLSGHRGLVALILQAEASDWSTLQENSHFAFACSLTATSVPFPRCAVEAVHVNASLRKAISCISTSCVARECCRCWDLGVSDLPPLQRRLSGRVPLMQPECRRRLVSFGTEHDRKRNRTGLKCQYSDRSCPQLYPS